MIEGALRLLGFCDEIVVIVDDRTADATEVLARRFTDKVFRIPFTRFDEFKNAGVERATGEWILFCDADERVTPRLAAQLRAAITSTEMVAFELSRINFFWGRRMNFGGWRELLPKFIRRDYASYVGNVHEQLVLPPEFVGKLGGELWHFSHRSIAENLRKTIAYGQLEASARRETSPPVGVWTFLRRMGRDFAWRMVRRTGWRDGMPGVIEGIFQPFAMFCASVMLWEMQQGDAIAERYEELERLVASET